MNGNNALSQIRAAIEELREASEAFMTAYENKQRTDGYAPWDTELERLDNVRSSADKKLVRLFAAFKRVP